MTEQCKDFFGIPFLNAWKIVSNIFQGIWMKKRHCAIWRVISLRKQVISHLELSRSMKSFSNPFSVSFKTTLVAYVDLRYSFNWRCLRDTTFCVIPTDIFSYTLMSLNTGKMDKCWKRPKGLWGAKLRPKHDINRLNIDFLDKKPSCFRCKAKYIISSSFRCHKVHFMMKVNFDSQCLFSKEIVNAVYLNPPFNVEWLRRIELYFHDGVNGAPVD